MRTNWAIFGAKGIPLHMGPLSRTSVNLATCAINIHNLCDAVSYSFTKAFEYITRDICIEVACATCSY